MVAPRRRETENAPKARGGGHFLVAASHPDTLTLFRDPLNISKTTLEEEERRRKRRTQAERETRKRTHTDIHYSAHKSTPARTHTLNIRTETHKEININTEYAPYS